MEKSFHYKRSPGRIIFLICAWIFLLFITVVCLMPIWHVIMASISNPTELNVTRGIVLKPLKNVDINAYKMILKYQKLWRGYRNTIMYCVLACALTGVMTVIAGYVFSRNRFRFRNTFMLLISFTMLFNGGMIPTYMVIRKIGFLDTVWAIVVPGCIGVFNIILMRTSMQGISDALEEAARLDGANDWTIYSKIMVPLSKPIMITIGLFSALGYWNNWTAGIYYINNPKLYTIQVYLKKLMDSIQFLKTTDLSNEAVLLASRSLPTESARMAVAIIALIPILAVYPFIQKELIKGMVVGGVKG